MTLCLSCFKFEIYAITFWATDGLLLLFVQTADKVLGVIVVVVSAMIAIIGVDYWRFSSLD